MNKGQGHSDEHQNVNFSNIYIQTQSDRSYSINIWMHDNIKILFTHVKTFISITWMNLNKKWSYCIQFELL